ncbi:MAG: hypothetical protein WCP28_16850 [Actinomycetes bacterium]
MSDTTSGPESNDVSELEAPASNQEPAAFSAIKTALAFLPPITLITGLLFYFGWARVQEQSLQMYQRDFLFSYSTTDYVLRSVDSLFFPLLVLSAFSIAFLALHRWLKRLIASGNSGWAAPAGRVVSLVGIVLLVFALLYQFGKVTGPPDGFALFPDVAAPAALAAGSILVAYGAWLHLQARPSRPDRSPHWHRTAAAGALSAIVALALFWGVGNYAILRGDAFAQQIDLDYLGYPAVTVYATKDLGLGNARLTTETGSTAAFPYRFTCLRLLDRVEDTWYLIPEDWHFSNKLILLQASSDVRFETEYRPADYTCPGLAPLGPDVSGSAAV